MGAGPDGRIAVRRRAEVARVAPIRLLAAYRGSSSRSAPRDALGLLSERRLRPRLLSIEDIDKLLAAALCTEPAGTVTPLTWHHLFGLMAATGLRISEALKLTLDDITPDGLILRDTKFGKSRMVALHPTTWDALHRYLEATPVLLGGIAKAAERSHALRRGGCHD